MQRRRRKIKIDYSKKKYANPFFQKRSAKNTVVKEHWPIKVWFYLFMIIILITGLIWLLFFSKYFIVNKLEITLPEKISKDEVQNIIWQQTNEKRFFLLHQSNLFLFNQEELRNTLDYKYSPGTLVITKKLPNKLIISIKERKYILVWHEAGKYYYVSDGEFTFETDPLQIKDKTLPIIENVGQPKIQNNQLLYSLEKINYLLPLFQKLTTGPKKFEIEKVSENDLNYSLKLKVLNGPELIFSIKDNMDSQINKLYAIINERIKNDFMKKNYINLMYGDKIYYQ